MSFSKPSAPWRKTGLTLIALLALLGTMSFSARASTYHMVDAQNGTGDMTIGVLGSSYSGGQWNFTLLATNTGSSTYNDVNLMLQFVWDQAAPPAPPQSALTYTNSNSWGGTVNSVSDSFSFRGYGIGAAPATTPLLAFPWTIANTPLNSLTLSSTTSKALASISSSDTLPTVPLGNFGPGTSETFNLACPSNNFTPNVIGLYVAVPEPSTIMILAFSGLSLLGYAWRRRALQG